MPINLKDVLKDARMIRNYKTTYRKQNDRKITRLWLEKTVQMN